MMNVRYQSGEVSVRYFRISNDKYRLILHSASGIPDSREYYVPRNLLVARPSREHPIRTKVNCEPVELAVAQRLRTRVHHRNQYARRCGSLYLKQAEDQNQKEASHRRSHEFPQST